MRILAKIVICAATMTAMIAAREGTQFVSAVQPASLSIAAGSSATAQLHFRVADGFHINSSRPKSDLLIPTELKLQPPTGVRVSGIKFPEGKELVLSFDPTHPLSVYSGDFLVETRLAAGAAAAPGHYQVRGELDYQACNDRACFPPRKLPVSLDVNILPAR